MLESEARALLGQLEDYRANWPELAGDFERRNEAAIATARKLIGSADPHNHHQETT